MKIFPYLTRYDTYEEAARGAELIFREWMKSRGIDISDYQEMWTD